MKITFMTVGKTDLSYVQEGVSVYQKRLGKYVVFDMVVIADLKNTRNLSIEEVKVREGQNILKSIESTDFLVLLDEGGEQFSSVNFSVYLQQLQLRNVKHLVFLCGGAYGFSSDVYARANGRLSLSRMTFSHQLVRVIFLEQLYRAFSILHHEPYHH